MTFPAFIFDTETTGLLDSRLIPLTRQPSIIEFYGAMVDLDDQDHPGQPLWELDTLLRPSNGLPVSAEIAKITGIDDEMVKDAPTFTQFMPLLNEALFKGSGFVAIAHNASFDVEMVDIELARLNLIGSWPPVVCTVEQTIHLKGHRLTLQGLHELLFEERFKEAHRARNDVTALIRCCVELRKRGCL
jgi:DNA polymerase III epsilon subunit-like protein